MGKFFSIAGSLRCLKSLGRFKRSFYLNIPAFACGTWIAVLLFRIIGLIRELDIAFPFGLSLYSYCFLVALPLTFLQWYWIGRLVDRLVAKRGDSGGKGNWEKESRGK